MDGYAPGDPLVALAIEEFATVKSAPRSEVTHSGAPEANSLFCTVYVPPEAGAVCSWHSVVVVAAGLALGTASPPLALTARATRKVPSATSSVAAMTNADLERATGYLRARRRGLASPAEAGL